MGNISIPSHLTSIFIWKTSQGVCLSGKNENKVTSYLHMSRQITEGCQNSDYVDIVKVTCSHFKISLTEN